MHPGSSKYHSILFKGLEHLRILVFLGILEPIPHRYGGTILNGLLNELDLIR